MHELIAHNLLALDGAPGGTGLPSLDWVRVIRQGLPAALIDSVALMTGMSRSELIRSLNLVERTILRRIKENDLLSRDETEKVVRLARTIERASQVFDDDANGLDWLRSKLPTLEGNRPLDLLDTDIGAHLVIDALGRIEHGIPT
jgi:putative toxin-antitoxin system antitoxin component (TIGR02293 family)